MPDPDQTARELVLGKVVEDEPADDAIDSEAAALDAAADEFITASEAGDRGGVARAFRAMFRAMREAD